MIVRQKLLTKLVSLWNEGLLTENIDRVPLEFVPRSSKHSGRCCIHKKRAVLKYKSLPLLGYDMADETDELTPLSDYAKQALDRTTLKDNIMCVIDEACSSCVRTNYAITNLCRGCEARACEHACPKNAIEFDPETSQGRINNKICISWGKCYAACPYHAIVYIPVPCEEACPVGAISKDEFGEVGKRIIEIFQRYEQTKFYKEQMSHNVAHELKTPVTAIRAYLETILDMPDADREVVKKFVEKSYAQSLRLTSLINDVSMLNKLDERSDSFVVEEVVLSQCINEVLAEMEYKLVANNVTFTSLISTNLRLNGCYTLIYSLFKNLIDNSIEHGGKGISITLSAGINQIAGDGGYRIDFTYTNTGKGIPEEKLPRLFERFYRIDEGRTRKTGGCGLGLAIVNNAVLYHRGEIVADNLPDGGVVFKFHLYSLK